MKTSKLVEPAEMNGSGKPVGGIEPVSTSYWIINSATKKEQMICSIFLNIPLLFDYN